MGGGKKNKTVNCVSIRHDEHDDELDEKSFDNGYTEVGAEKWTETKTSDKRLGKRFCAGRSPRWAVYTIAHLIS